MNIKTKDELLELASEKGRGQILRVLETVGRLEKRGVTRSEYSLASPYAIPKAHREETRDEQAATVTR